MPKVSQIQATFNAGELSPLLYGNVVSPRYKQGLSTCLNYIPTLQGPLTRRPATKYLTNVKDSTKPPILVPFQFSVTQAYVFEFGDKYIRFCANNGQVVTSGTTYKISGTYSNLNTNGTGLGQGYLFTATRAGIAPASTETVATHTSVSSGSILELASPYSYSDLPLLRWAQSNDTLYLVHPKYPPYKLQRFSAQFWTLKQVAFQDGPYLALNTYATYGDSTGITLSYESTSQPLVTVQTGPAYNISGAIADPAGSGQIQITTSAANTYVSGQKVFVEFVGGTVEANNYQPIIDPTQPYSWTITVTSTTTFLLQGSTFVHTYTTGGSVYPALFDNTPTQGDLGRTLALDVAGQRYWGVIVPGTDGAQDFTHQATIFCNTSATGNGGGPPTQSSFTAATSWQLGVWSVGNGFPACVTFHQDRLVFSGCPSYPQEVDFSTTSKYENFAPNDPTTLEVNDNNAMQFTLNSADANPVQWMKSTAQGLLAGTYSAEWAMTPDSNAQALTPTNFNAAQTSFYGSATADAVPMGNAVLYIQRSNRKVRELNFFFQVGTFRSTDLTELSEHITLPSVIKIASQKETQPLLWAIRADGALLSMIYNRDDVSIQAGWTRHTIGGQSDSSGTPPIVQSMAIIPAPDTSFDQLWLTVQRYINGQSVICIEYMTKIFDDLALQEDAFQGDCGGTYDNPLTITGISIASPCVVTSVAHGLTNGSRIRIESVIGLGQTTTDVNGNQTYSNLVNNLTFVVAGVTTNTFQLNDFNGNAISSVGYGAWISGGTIRKLVTTISGLTWLEGETVGVLADGGLHPNVTVSSGGTITLQYAAAKVQIGYPFNSDGQQMRVEGGAADGTSIGKTRRTTRAAFMMHRIGQLLMGTSFSRLIPLKFTRADVQLADQATPLYSGIVRDGLESAYDFESQVCFRQNSMLPGTICALTSFMEEQDV